MDKVLIELAKDIRLSELIKKYGTPSLSRKTGYFQALVRSIIYQQVTGKAAAAIMARFVALFSSDVEEKSFPTPAEVSQKTIEELRTAGLSRQKASYLLDLAEKFTDGTIQESKLKAMSTPELVEHLTLVKGIGVWTVHMFLIFTLGRLDVLPTGDLGVRKGFQVVYKLRELPTKEKMEKLAKPWLPFASVVSWYLWRVADDIKVKKTKTVKKVLSKK